MYVLICSVTVFSSGSPVFASSVDPVAGKAVEELLETGRDVELRETGASVESETGTTFPDLTTAGWVRETN